MKVRQLLGIVLFAAICVSHSIGQERQEPAPNVLPEFNWDRVPVSAHFGIGDGLDPEQYDFVAQHFNFITLTAGRLPRDSQGSAETYTAQAARAIKTRNPKAKVLFYWASDKPKAQSKISNAAYPGEYIIHTRNCRGWEETSHQVFRCDSQGGSGLVV